MKSSDIIMYNDLFNYTAQELGETYTHYSWQDAGELGKIESGEIHYDNKALEKITASDVRNINTILKRALQIKSHTIVFDPSEATPSQRVYEKVNAQNTNKLPFDPTLPSADELFSNMERYLQIPSTSCQESLVADQFQSDLEKLGFSVFRDTANQEIECNGSITGSDATIQAQTGNVIGHLNGDPALPTWHLSCHLDGTQPQISSIPYVREGNIVRAAKGEPILRADDTNGIILILALIKALQDNHIPHGTIYVSGLIAEEAGAYGAQKIASENLQGDIGLVFDGLLSNEIIYGGSDIYTWSMLVRGKSEHVALANEAINADVISGQILVNAWGLNEKSSWHGRADTVIKSTTTSGTAISTTDINGNSIEIIKPSNSIPDRALLTGQVRTSESNSSVNVLDKMNLEAQAICKQFGAECEFKYDLALPGYQDKSSPVLSLIRDGYTQSGYPAPEFVSSHGGSNVNFTFDRHGGNIVLMPAGLDKPHTANEYADLDDMIKIIDVTLKMFDIASDYSKKMPDLTQAKSE